MTTFRWILTRKLRCWFDPFAAHKVFGLLKESPQNVHTSVTDCTAEMSEAVPMYTGFLETLAHKPVCRIVSDVVLYQ